jgi:hypothetical protein
VSESVDVVWLRDDFRLDDRWPFMLRRSSPRSSFTSTTNPAAGRVRLSRPEVVWGKTYPKPIVARARALAAFAEPRDAR